LQADPADKGVLHLIVVTNQVSQCRRWATGE